jgi:hypothetical protein
VVPLCPRCHRLYDDGAISILEHLEPHYRVELAYAVVLVGLVAAIERTTNERWAPRRLSGRRDSGVSRSADGGLGVF